MTPLIVVFALSSVVIILVALPMMHRRVGPNGLYGLRTPATFADEWVWYEANARSGLDFLILGVLLLVLTFVLPAFGIDHDAYALWWSAVAVVGAVVAGIVGWRRANRLLTERRRTEGAA